MLGAGLASWWGGLSAGTQTLIGATAASAVGAGVTSALQPKLPSAPAATSMPDQQQVQRQEARNFLMQYGRGGRASTILSDASGGTALG